MKKVILTAFVLSLAIVGFSQRKAQKLDKPSATTTASAETSIPKELQGTWMYGNFSTTEYWSTSPGTYLGNALTFAIAFTNQMEQRPSSLPLQEAIVPLRS
ncbi:MAG: hypothetical protein EON98_08120 [Chitinophagaceae bacterium]|nr:MAG: hypothetical protein EON98_08120 [Chitinophagaceae bacterium]